MRGALRPLPIFCGLTLIAAYARLSESVAFRAELGKAFVYLNWREGLFWISHYSLLVPGLLLLAWGLAPRLAAPMARAWQWLRAVPRRAGWVALAGYALTLFSLAIVGRAVLLLGLPITNDEHTVLFGARIVAEGELTAPSVDPELGLPMPFVHHREGRMYSMDFPGAILFAAAALVTGAGFSLYALLTAISGAALVAACGRLDGRRGVVAAALMWLASPMVLALSMTTHAHLSSRSFVALAVAAYLCLVASPARLPATRAALWGGALGLFAGLAFLCRSAEAGAVLAPAGLHLLIRAARSPGGSGDRVAALAAAVTGALAPLTLAWYNAQTSGLWYVSPRVVDNKTMHEPWWPAMWERLGDNLGFNVMMLIVWFLGPLGAALACLGLSTRKPNAARPLAAVFGSSLALQLGLALFHSDTGNHLVGPIHYSEAAVPLLVLSVLGLRAVGAWLARLDLEPTAPALLLVFYLVSLGAFSAVHSATLRDQATINRAPLDAVAGLENAVVIADRPYKLWFTRPEIGEIGSWMADLPHPDPYLRDPVIFAYPEGDPQALLARFPDRRFYRMTYHPTGDPIRVAPLRVPSDQNDRSTPIDTEP